MSQREKELAAVEATAREHRINIERHWLRELWAANRHRDDNTLRKVYTRSAIAEMNERGGYFFFSKKTMRFFGDKQSNYCVVVKDGAIRMRRIKEPSRPPPGTIPAGVWYTFNPETGKLTKEGED